MKNEKYLLIAIFASVRFFLYQSLLYEHKKDYMPMYDYCTHPLTPPNTKAE